MQRAVQWTYYLDNSIFVAQQLFMCCHGFWWVPKMLKSLCSKYPKGLYINKKNHNLFNPQSRQFHKRSTKFTKM